MNSNPRYVNLEKIVTFQEGYVNPSQTNHNYFDGDVKWLRAVDLNDSEVWDTSRKLSVIGFESAGKSALMFKPNTIAISKSGTIGRLGILKDFMCGNRAVINLEVDENQADLLFVFYSLIMARREIIQYAVGSVQANLYPSVLGKLKIWLPPITIQRKISSILCSLDETKINNQNLSSKSNDIISALFRSWFIDFDPVKAKSEGKLPYGMNEETAALFPDSFQDSELGTIPAGWEVKNLIDYVEIVYGAPFNSKLFNTKGNGLPIIRNRDLIEQNPSTYTPELHPKKQIVISGDIVVGMDGQFNSHCWRGPDSVLNQRICLFRPKENISHAFVEQIVKEPLREIEFGSAGTTVIHIGKKNIDSIRTIYPSKDVLEAFGKIVRPLFEHTKNCSKTNMALVKTRDALLPRLMSGELKVN